LIELAALSVLLLIVALGSTRLSSERRRLGSSALAASGTGAVMFALVFVPGHGFLLAIGAFAMGGVGWLAAARRALARARATSRTVQLVCAELADDLRVGRTPEDALAAAGRRWPELGPAATAALMHHDVPRALHEVSRLPGAEGLRDVAVAWQISARAGSGLAEALERVSQLLAVRERRVRLIESELAAARATAMVVSGLPVLVLGMGSGLGTNPWSFFLSGIGAGTLFVGVVLMLAGWAWIDRLGSREVSR